MDSLNGRRTVARRQCQTRLVRSGLVVNVNLGIGRNHRLPGLMQSTILSNRGMYHHTLIMKLGHAGNGEIIASLDIRPLGVWIMSDSSGQMDWHWVCRQDAVTCWTCQFKSCPVRVRQAFESVFQNGGVFDYCTTSLKRIPTAIQLNRLIFGNSVFLWIVSRRCARKTTYKPKRTFPPVRILDYDKRERRRSSQPSIALPPG